VTVLLSLLVVCWKIAASLGVSGCLVKGNDNYSYIHFDLLTEKLSNYPGLSFRVDFKFITSLKKTITKLFFMGQTVKCLRLLWAGQLTRISRQ
jgi:hypothetical protein